APAASAPAAAPSPQSASAPAPAAQARAPQPAAAATNGHAARVFSSPLARRLAKDSGIDIAMIPGSGPHERVLAPQRRAARSGRGRRRARGGPGPAPFRPPSDDKIRALFEAGSYEIVPHDSMRKAIARRIAEAKATIPHFYLTSVCNVDRLLTAREDVNATA